MRERVSRIQAFAGVGVAAALLAAGVGVSFVTPAHALGPAAALTDTAPPPEPSPDPAPAPAPPPKPVTHPAPVYHAPTHHYTPPVHSTPAPTYTHSYTPTHAYTPPAPVTPVTSHATHKKHAKRHIAAKPKPVPTPQPQTTPAPAPIQHVNLGSPTAAVTATGAADSLRRMLVIAGIGAAALLFLIVLAVPATEVRFTAPGRVVTDHQIDLVLAGVATLLLTAVVFALTS